MPKAKSISQSDLEGFELDEISFKGDLDNWLTAFTETYAVRLQKASVGAKGRDVRATNAWFRRVAYRLIRKSIEGQVPYNQLFDRIEEFGRSLRGVKGRQGQFERGLLAIVAHDPKLMSAGQRYQNGRQLDYAHHHRIPPEFLEAFLRDISARTAIDNAGLLEVAPDYEKWVIGRLIEEATPKVELRAYPIRIRRRVAKGIEDGRAQKKEQAAYYYRLAHGFPEPARDWDSPVLAVHDEIAGLVADLGFDQIHRDAPQMEALELRSEIEAVVKTLPRDVGDPSREAGRRLSSDEMSLFIRFAGALRLQPKPPRKFRW